ncbi:MAG: cytoplasmic protein [Deltaproteobacteria bacterium]|nr:cytoplasmic protein [Deltaproteobacteria bacterium]MBW1909544.1 cytoplasmic protein [Deltaproteobacteria bacterium]MBW2032635.1 cytoplasmic protein [Deltaproteobacteria bacterium]MBW2114034.1 cytoplasmic protein [Deltaproteobacteria bacterium]MBW2167947.1 cytoplasmic protein [Deltaproteobacteria bacterium]
MAKHSHRFVEEYDGFVGIGFSREVDESTLTYYLQKFSDDELMAVIRKRMSDSDIEALFDLLSRLMKQYLSEEEYHRYFFKDKESNGDMTP